MKSMVIRDRDTPKEFMDLAVRRTNGMLDAAIRFPESMTIRCLLASCYLQGMRDAGEALDFKGIKI